MYSLQAPHPSNNEIFISLILDADTQPVAAELATAIRRSARLLDSFVPDSYTTAGNPKGIGTFIVTFSFRNHLRSIGLIARNHREAKFLLDILKSNGTLCACD